MKRILYIMLLIITVISLTLALYSCDNDDNSGNGGSQGSGDGGSQDSGNSGTQDNGGNGTYTPDPDFVQPPLGNTVGKTAFSKALTLVDGSGTVSVSELREGLLEDDEYNRCNQLLGHVVRSMQVRASRL